MKEALEEFLGFDIGVVQFLMSNEKLISSPILRLLPYRDAHCLQYLKIMEKVQSIEDLEANPDELIDCFRDKPALLKIVLDEPKAMQFIRDT